MSTRKTGRNWTKDETELFITVLVEQNDNFASTLEQKALKKAANVDAFQHIQDKFNSQL